MAKCLSKTYVNKGRAFNYLQSESYGGTRPFFFIIMKFSFFLLHCVPLYVCRLCINYQDLSTKLLGVGALRMLLLTFTSRFVIDFLSIRKVIIFSANATDDRHPRRSRSIHQNGVVEDVCLCRNCSKARPNVSR